MSTSLPKPLAEVTPNTAAFTELPMILPAGFREYDARWRYPEQINLIGIKALGLGLGTQLPSPSAATTAPTRRPSRRP